MTIDLKGEFLTAELARSDGIFALRGDLDGGKDVADFSNVQQFIGLLISNDEFLLPIAVLNEIIMINQLTFVPRSPRHVEGVINLRGKILPAINLRTMMGHGTVPPTAASRIIIANHEGIMAGLIVDGITYVISLNPDQLEEKTLAAKGSAAELVKGISKRGDRVNGILDLTKILQEAGYNSKPDDVAELDDM